jgi:hypothetical protein
MSESLREKYCEGEGEQVEQQSADDGWKGIVASAQILGGLQAMG